MGQAHAKLLEVHDHVLVLEEGLAKVADDHVAAAQGSDVQHAFAVGGPVDVVLRRDLPRLPIAAEPVLDRRERARPVAVDLEEGPAAVVDRVRRVDGLGLGHAHQVRVRVDRERRAPAVRGVVEDGTGAGGPVDRLGLVADAQAREGDGPVLVQRRVVNEVEDVDEREADDVVPRDASADTTPIVAPQRLSSVRSAARGLSTVRRALVALMKCHQGPLPRVAFPRLIERRLLGD